MDEAKSHIKLEITQAFANVQRMLGQQRDPFTDEVRSSHASDSAFDHLEETQLQKDQEQFEQLRQTFIQDIETLDQQMRHAANLKKITKEACKNMVANPLQYF